MLIVLTLFSFASCNNNPGVSEGTSSLTIHVSEAASKLIGFNPDGGEPLAISHYGISLKDDDGTELKKTETPIALSGGSGSFTITGLVTGNYTIDATGYVKNGDDYVEVATGTSGEIFVSPTTGTETTILIDTWKDGNAESITIDVVMPSDVLGADGNLAMDGTLKYTMTEVGTGTVTIPEKSISLATGQTFTEGKYALTVNGDVGPGRYILSVSFTSESADKDYSNADAVLVYPGLPVTGTISIDSHSVFDEDFTVSNALGEPLTVEGDGVYSSEASTFTVTLSKALESTQKIVWYADGTALVENTGYTVSENVYTFTGVSAGEHYFVGIVYEEGKAASVGSIQLTISVAEPDFKFPSHFAYTDNGDGTCTITGENPDSPLPSHDGLVIPDEIDDLKVTGIGKEAFREKDFTGALVLGKNVQTIGEYAFANNEFSGDLIITEVVTEIGDWAFYRNKFTGSLVIPNSVIEIGENAFYYNEFDGSLTLGSKIQNIEEGAFAGKKYGSESCYNSFTGSLVIPDSVKTIGEGAFERNKFDGSLTFGKNLETIGEDAFTRNLFTGSLAIPDSVIEIGAYAFSMNKFNGTLTLGANVQHIGNSAFSSQGNTSYNQFTGNLIIPDSVIEIGSSAFSTNNFNGTLTLGKNLQTIGSSAFYRNEFTGDLIIPDNVLTIGNQAFSNNYFNGTLTLGSRLQDIGEYSFVGGTFGGGNDFTGSLVIPEGVISIGIRAFYQNSFSGNLTIPNSMTSIGVDVFNGNEFDGTLTLGNNIETISDSAFAFNDFTGSLVIPDSVISIDDSAFKGNSFNGTLTLGKNVQIIGEGAFAGNIYGHEDGYNMFTGSLVIPDSVISIGDGVFEDNMFNGTLTLGKNIETIESDAFRGNEFTGDLLIPVSTTTVGANVIEDNLFTSVNCEASEQPSGWNAEWNSGCDAEVTWGYTAE